MAPSATPGPRPRGRPVEIDPAQLSRVAIDLFEERGYDDVSAAEVAQAAGVSRRSLFRYFPSKADLVWDGFATGLEVLSVALLEHGQEPPVEAVKLAFITAAERTPVVELTRTRLRIIATHSDLMSIGVGRLDEQLRICTTYLRTRGVDPLTAQAQAAAITAAAFTGYVYWATETNEPRPLETVRRALESLGDL